MRGASGQEYTVCSPVVSIVMIVVTAEAGREDKENGEHDGANPDIYRNQRIAVSHGGIVLEMEVGHAACIRD